MDTTHLPPDFKEFIQHMNSEMVEYLLVGGYAVGFHGAPRFTADIDIWVDSEHVERQRNWAERLKVFGFRDPEIIGGRCLKPNSVFRVGSPPLQIDIRRKPSGRDLCRLLFPRREEDSFDDDH